MSATSPEVSGTVESQSRPMTAANSSTVAVDAGIRTNSAKAIPRPR